MTKNDEKIARIRDPLFVIGLSLELIKQRSSDTRIKSDLRRIDAAMEKIEQIIQ